MSKEGERVMNNRVNLDNSSGKSLGFQTIFIFSSPAHDPGSWKLLKCCKNVSPKPLKGIIFSQIKVLFEVKISKSSLFYDFLKYYLIFDYSQICFAEIFENPTTFSMSVPQLGTAQSRFFTLKIVFFNLTNSSLSIFK